MSFPVKFDIPVAWGEMDAFGHVNNTVYFKYFESARITYFRAIQDNKTSSDGFAPILAHTECQFLKPVVFPDTLTAEASVVKVGNTSFTMAYRLTSHKQESVVAEGKAVVVNVDPKTGKGVPLTDEVKAKIAALEKRL